MEREQYLKAKKAIRESLAEITASPEEAKKILVKSGIYTEKGNLTKRYSQPGHQGPDCPWQKKAEAQ